MATTTTPEPGWYQDPGGIVRWWDGNGWTDAVVPPPAPPPPFAVKSGPDPKTLAMLSNIGGLVGGWIPPLIVYLMDKGQNRWVRHCSSEALNFQLTLLLVNVIALPVFFIAFFGGFFAFAASPSSATPVFGGLFTGGFLVFWLLLMALAIANVVFSIMGMIRTNRGEWFTYPVRIKFVKGYVPEEARY